MLQNLNQKEFFMAMNETRRTDRDAARRPGEPNAVDSNLDRDDDLNDPLAIARDDEADRKNRDPISGTPGAHPVGVGVGAAAGGATGAAIGSVIPGAGTLVGATIGAVVGGVAGGYAGKGVAEAINPTEEDRYWRDAHSKRPYFNASSGYNYDSDYAPAYRYGHTSYSRTPNQRFEDVEDSLQADWDTSREKSKLDWDSARHAIRDAWDRADSSKSRPDARRGNNPVD